MPTSPPTPDSRAIAAAISARNARIVLRGDAQIAQLLRFLFALALAIAGALLLLHYLAPCDAGALCAAAAVTRSEDYHEGEYTGYRAGWYWGVVCGACAGGLVGMLVMLASLQFGLLAGGSP